MRVSMRSLTSASAMRNNREAGMSINESEERLGLRVANGSIWRKAAIRYKLDVRQVLPEEDIPSVWFDSQRIKVACIT